MPQSDDLVVESLFEESVVPLANPAAIKLHKLKGPFGMDQAVRVKAHFAVYPERRANVPPNAGARDARGGPAGGLSRARVRPLR